jgi:hypothetical protein
LYAHWSQLAAGPDTPGQPFDPGGQAAFRYMHHGGFQGGGDDQPGTQVDALAAREKHVAWVTRCGDPHQAGLASDAGAALGADAQRAIWSQ